MILCNLGVRSDGCRRLSMGIENQVGHRTPQFAALWRCLQPHRYQPYCMHAAVQLQLDMTLAPRHV